MQQNDKTACETARAEQPQLVSDGVWLYCNRDAEGKPFRVRLQHIMGYDLSGPAWTVLRTAHPHRASIGIAGNLMAQLDAIFATREA